MWHKASSLENALAIATDMKAAGTASWFRGQTRPWPLVSSFVRKKKPHERQAAIERFRSFNEWIRSVPESATIAGDDDAVLAVAQHYHLATNLLDFSTEPKVAAFFSAQPPPRRDAWEDIQGTRRTEDVSCIVCLDPAELTRVYESVRIVRPNMPEPKCITIDVRELWRLQAQRGVFLEYPFDEGFERHTFGFDRIIFPTERDPSVLERLIPRQDIYPTQKSDLEILLDQFFMLERMAEGSKAAAQGDWTRVRLEGPVDGIEAECFDERGLPVHQSWDRARLVDWLDVEREDWIPASAAPEVSVQYPSANGSPEKIDVLRRQILESLTTHPSLRKGPVKWLLIGAPGEIAPIVRAMDLVWDGVRRWPYDSNDVAQALATAIEYGVLVGQTPAARREPRVAQRLAEQCIGDVIETEIAMQDGSYTRGYANARLLFQTIRDDFVSFLREHWRPQITDIRHVVQIASSPTRALVFDRLKSIFCTQIVPTQVVLRDEASGKARLYNAARAVRLGLP